MQVDKLHKSFQELRGQSGVQDAASESTSQYLQTYTQDVTSKAEKGELDPVVGRDEIIRRTIQVLQRRRKNNPVIIGEPGVGKTAIIEGLALRIVNKQVPEGLQNKRVLSLDFSNLIAGAGVRGEFEKRLKGLLGELSKKQDEYILFIDEIHTMVGAGKAEGSMDAGNMLKPALSRGELHCVGATTLDEYRNHIEKDPALERRFQKVLVTEPSEYEAIAIMRGLKEKYEVHHRVDIADTAVVAAVKLSHRYITDRKLPDKAIDLIDEAASRVRMEIDSNPEEIEQLSNEVVQMKMEREIIKDQQDRASQKRLQELEQNLAESEKDLASLLEELAAEKNILATFSELKTELDQARLEMDRAKRSANLTRMSELQYGLIPELEKKLAEAESQQPNTKLIRTKVTEDEVADVVAKATGIPVSKMIEEEKTRLLELENIMHQRVVGQDMAISAIADSIRRSRSGLSDPNRPIGSFLFLGPTGVGKTEVCKALAQNLFDSENALVRFDMSEFMEKHTVARLVGAPPGYVGYEEGGKLTEAVRRKPYCVVLFDEVEKAHPDVFNLFLQVLDDGRLTDSQGRQVSFTNTVVVMTSNLGSGKIIDMYSQPPSMSSEDSPETTESKEKEFSAANVDYEQLKELVLHDVKGFFRPEFINRIDEVVVFHPLMREQVKSIAYLLIDKLNQRLQDKELSLKLDEAAMELLLKHGYDPLYGARPMRRTIQKWLEVPLSRLLLDGNFEPNSCIEVGATEEGELSFSVGSK